MISGKVLKSELDENGNIRVETEYILTDGSKKIGNTRYNALGFSRNKIQEDVDTHCKTLMKRVWMLKQNQVLVSTKVDDITKDLTSMELIIKPAVLDKDGTVITPAEKITIDDN